MINILIGVFFCMVIGGLTMFVLSIFISGANQIATGDDRKKGEKQAKQAETVGKVLGIIGTIGLIVMTVINRFLIS